MVRIRLKQVRAKPIIVDGTGIPLKQEETLLRKSARRHRDSVTLPESGNQDLPLP